MAMSMRTGTGAAQPGGRAGRVPTVSLIIPVYNAAATLARCLDDVAAQTYPELEVLLVNDGSDDGSEALCRDAVKRFSRFRLVNRENGGPAAARNTGLDEASGAYVAFLDADDRMAPDAIATMVRAAESEDADMVIGNYRHVVGDTVTARPYRYASGIYEGEKKRALAEALISDMAPGAIPPYSFTRLLRRDLIEDPPARYDAAIRRSEDYLFFTQLHFRATRIVVLGDRYMVDYVDEPGSITRSYVPGYWDAVKRIVTTLREQLPDTEAIRRHVAVMALQRTMIALNNATRAPSKAIFDEALRAITGDPMLRRVVRALTWRVGLREVGSFFLLLKLHLYPLVRARYRLKW